MKTQKMFYSISEIAEMLGVGQQTVLRLIKNGTLKAMKLGRIYRIAAPDLKQTFAINNLQTTDTQTAKQPLKQVNFELEMDKFTLLKQYSISKRIKLRDILTQCVTDFLQKQVTNIHTDSPQQTINGKYSFFTE